MMKKADLLFELGTEELPPKALKSMALALARDMAAHLQKAELPFDNIQPFATPRRLALIIHGLASAQQDKQAERRGPALKAAYDGQGNPSKAAMGFAASCGIDVSQLQTLETEKGAWLVARVKQTGQQTVSLLPGMLQQALGALPIPKRMRWADHSFQFVRPVHWLVLIFDGKPVTGELFGLPFGDQSVGHRFHHPGPVALPRVDAYVDNMLHANVMVDFEKRRASIADQVSQLARQQHGHVVLDDDLLDEVTGLVEWPVSLLGRFEERFLQVPAEALIAAMKNHQRYFHVLDDNDRIMPCFIAVSNIESLDPDVIRRGNERVIRLRLSDAEFFWNSDRKTALLDRLPVLKDVIFQKALGSVYDKTMRISKLAVFIAEQTGADPVSTETAAQLCKCDLLSDMVGEFPELQGIMGRYYALHDGHDPAIADAIDEHYRPRGAGDQLPPGDIGRCLALADRLDTLLGLFAVGKIPSGDKDPFGLRRASLAVLRILIEQNLELDLMALLQRAATRFSATVTAADAVEPLFDFMMDRLRTYYADRDVRPDVLEAVLARRPVHMTDLNLRIQAIKAFRKMPEAESLAAANKRIGNILKKSDDTIPDQFDVSKLSAEQERQLAQALAQKRDTVEPMLAARDYESAMRELAGLREIVDHFFDHVMVNVQEQAVRINRLALLKQFNDLFLRIADLSRLQ